MKKSVLRFPSSSMLIALLRLTSRLLSVFIGVNLWLLFVFSSTVHASPQPSNDVHFCLPLDTEDMRTRDSIYAATKHALNLNVGEPRTVRMIYFLPNDRPFRQEVVDSMKVTIRQIQTFYAEQMQAHGYGNKTFRFETDARGEPLVHRVDGQHPDSHYLDNTSTTVIDEIRRKFDTQANIYFTVIDNSINAIGTGYGRFAGGTGNIIALVPGGFHWTAAAHELGHVFGLKHDFRDGNYIMSYGPSVEVRLSACHAEFLSVHRYFNPDIPIEEDSESGFRELTERTPFFELMSSREYPAGSKSVSIQLKVSDPEGLHQVILFVGTKAPHGAAGSLEVKMCHGLGGETDAIVQFDYDGVIPSDSGTSLSDPVRHSIYVLAVDTEGNVRGAFFPLIEISPQLIATLKQTDSGVISVAFSPDGTTLASASNSSIVNLWDLATRTNIATLHDGSWSIAFSPDGSILASGIKMWDTATKEHIATLGKYLNHGHRSHAIAFSPDGSILVSGSYVLDGGTIELWDVATKQHIATLSGHGGWVFSVAFSPDGRTLASGGSGDDGVIKLWDVATKQHVATLSDARVNVSGAGSIAFSPDGTILASGSGSGYTRHLLNLWDVATQEHIATLVDGSEPVAFSPDGRTLASGSSRGAGGGINLWDVATKEHIATLSGHTRRVQAIAFSPDGDILASGAEGDMIKLWDMSALGLGGTSQANFSLSLDGDVAAGDQAVTSIDISPGEIVSIQVFGKDIQGAEGFSIRFEYDETQVLYEGFDPGSVLPNAQVVSVPGTNPTAIEIWIASFGGKAAANSGLLGRIRFRTTSAFSGTTLRLMRAELGRGEERERITFDDTSVTLQLAALTPDFNGDGRVDLDDFLLFVEHLGFSRGDEGYDAKYDLNEDGVIGFGDFLIFASSFGDGG